MLSMLPDCIEIGRISLKEALMGHEFIIMSIMNEPTTHVVGSHIKQRRIRFSIHGSRWNRRKSTIYLELTWNSGQGIPAFWPLNSGREGIVSISLEILQRLLATHPEAMLIFRWKID